MDTAIVPASPRAIVAMGPQANFEIPAEDAMEFYSADYSDKVRSEVRRWLHAFKRVAVSVNGRGRLIQTLQVEARIAGVSFGSLRAKWYAYDLSGGEWRVLVNRSLKGSGRQWTARCNLPPEFVDEVGRRAGNNQRCFAAAYVQIIKQWRRWRRHGLPEDAIPGYRTAPEPDARGRHPHGWSRRNLYRRLPKRAELTLARIGTAAAAEELVLIPGTRHGMRFMEWVSFDDVWNDRKVCVPPLLDPCRLLQLGAFDLASGSMLKIGVRPEMPNADDSKRERLKKLDMLMLVAAFLADYGYPLDYAMHLILERGTATLYAADAKALYDYTGGRVVCGYTEMNGRFVRAWDESRRGNPRGKGAHESWHNLFHNWSASEPGQVGKDRDHQPAILAAQEREVHQLNTIARVMTDAQRARLQFPFPSLDKAHERVLQIVQEINEREDHACEGFDRVTWWRIKGVPMDWQPEGTLAAVPPGTPLEYDSRVETPHQRMLRLSSGVRLAKVPGSLLRAFVEDSRVKKPIARAGFAFTLEGKNYEYLAPSPDESLPEGTLLTGHFSPLDMAVIHLTDEAGIFVGTWKRFGPFHRGNAAEQAEAQRVRGAYLAHAVNNVRRRHAPDLLAQQARMDANLSVVAEAGLIPAPTARTLAQFEAHVAPGADGLGRALERQRVDSEKRRAAHDAVSHLSARDFLPRANHPDSNDTAPAIASDEGCWIPEPDQPDCESLTD